MRVRILCEDRRTERFIRRLCASRGIRVVDVDVAPKGKGDASVYVRSRYAAHVRQRRSKSFQQNLGGLVVIDGDDKGVTMRKEELEQTLANAGLSGRSAEEPFAIFVPTWSIETWLAVLAALVGGGPAVEAASLKEDAALRSHWNDGEAEGKTIKSAVERWRATAAPVPSLEGGYIEAKRLRL